MQYTSRQLQQVVMGLQSSWALVLMPCATACIRISGNVICNWVMFVLWKGPSVLYLLRGYNTYLMACLCKLPGLAILTGDTVVTHLNQSCKQLCVCVCLFSTSVYNVIAIAVCDYWC